MPVIEFQRLPPDSDEGEFSSKGDYFTVAMYSAVVENPNYNARLSKWLGVLQLSVALCSVIDGIVTVAIQYCSFSFLGTPIWSGFPCFFLAGLLALMSRDKKTRTIRVYMICSFIAMLVALMMISFMLVGAFHDYHGGYPYTYVSDMVASKRKACFGFDIFGIILGFVEVFAALTGILIGSDRNRQLSSAHPLGCQVMGDVL